MDNLPKWSELARGYKNESKDFIIKNKESLGFLFLYGIISALASIFISTLVSIGSLGAYFWVILAVSAIFGPSDLDDSNHNRFAVSFPWHVSTLMISLFIGLYIISISNGSIENYVSAVLSLGVLSIGIVVLMILYGVALSVLGSMINDGFDRVFDEYSNAKDEGNHKDEGESENRESKSRDRIGGEHKEKSESLE